MTDDNLNKLLSDIKESSANVQDNVLCYFYHNTSNCTKCPLKDSCKGSETAPRYTILINRKYLTTIDQHGRTLTIIFRSKVDAENHLKYCIGGKVVEYTGSRRNTTER